MTVHLPSLLHGIIEGGRCLIQVEWAAVDVDAVELSLRMFAGDHCKVISVIRTPPKYVDNRCETNKMQNTFFDATLVASTARRLAAKLCVHVATDNRFELCF